MAIKSVKYTAYRPSEKVKELQHETYGHVEAMVIERNRTWPHFNGPEGNRTLIQYIDDNDRRLNGFRPTKEEQDKEEWQANVFDNVTRVKLKAFCAGIALQIPDQEYKAVNKDGLYSAQRAEAMKQLVRHSRIVEDNPQLQTFFEAWEMLGKGTVIKYDGYLKIKHNVKIIDGYDPETGEVKFHEEEVISENRCIDVQVPLSELFIWDFTVLNIQDQVRLAWVQHYNYDQLKKELGHLPNFKYVKDKKSISKFQTSTVTHFYDSWSNRVQKENDYEVVKLYSVVDDKYEIWCNGVDLLLAPMLWGKKKKRYPFAKTIREPFNGKQFFYGMALPHELEGHQDMKNIFWNTTLDKHIRSLLPPMLVGMANKDLLDLEDEYVNQDNKIYVPDISQVKPMPYAGASNSDVMMINMIQRALDLQSTDANQSGVTGKGVTAREIELADQNARKLKGITFMFLEDLHLQKTRNRILNILMNYMPVQEVLVVGKNATQQIEKAEKIFNVTDVKLSDGTVGTLGIKIVDTAQNLPGVTDIEATEQAMNDQGINYKMVATTSDYFDDWDFDFTVVPESLYAQDRVREEATFNEKLDRMAALFPEWFVANKDQLFGEFVEVYGDTKEQYSKPAPAPVAQNGSVPVEPGSPLDDGSGTIST
jgi:hypothetical protein